MSRTISTLSRSATVEDGVVFAAHIAVSEYSSSATVEDGGIFVAHITVCEYSSSATVEDGGIFVAHIARCGKSKPTHRAVEDGGTKNRSMAHTHTNLLSHIVFSTQGHLPFIAPEMKSELFAYMAALVKELKGKPIIINGMSDHVHLLILLPPNVSVSDAMRFVKANSSRWVKERFGKKFAWQKGFGAFSVSRSNVDAVAKYIREQEQHHKGSDFKTEFVALLDKNDVDYDVRDLWS